MQEVRKRRSFARITLAGFGAATFFSLACGETNPNASHPNAGAAGSAAGATAGQSASAAGKPSTNGGSGSGDAGASHAGSGGANNGGSNASGAANLSGTAGQAEAGGVAGIAGAGGQDTGGSCEQTCRNEGVRAEVGFCGTDETSWMCPTLQFDREVFEAHCHTAPTNAIRYCCPANFDGECQ
jgi:hypothetical protein